MFLWIERTITFELSGLHPSIRRIFGFNIKVFIWVFFSIQILFFSLIWHSIVLNFDFKFDNFFLIQILFFQINYFSNLLSLSNCYHTFKRIFVTYWFEMQMFLHKFSDELKKGVSHHRHTYTCVHDMIQLVLSSRVHSPLKSIFLQLVPVTSIFNENFSFDFMSIFSAFSSIPFRRKSFFKQ